MNKIIITGGAGYVGSKLVPKLLDLNYEVTVLDLMIYGEDVLPNHKNLKKIKGDIRDINLLNKIIPGNEIVIHLACISNDPSFELNPSLGKSIIFDDNLLSVKDLGNFHNKSKMLLIFFFLSKLFVLVPTPFNVDKSDKRYS